MKIFLTLDIKRQCHDGKPLGCCRIILADSHERFINDREVGNRDVATARITINSRIDTYQKDIVYVLDGDSDAYRNTE